MARVAGEASLDPDSESESGGSDNEEMGDRPNSASSNQASKIPALTKIAQDTLTQIDSPLDGPDQEEVLHHGGLRETGSVNADGIDTE